MPPQKLKLAVSQSRTLSTPAETLEALKATTQQAAKDGVDLVLFPEAYLGGYVGSTAIGVLKGQYAKVITFKISKDMQLWRSSGRPY